MSKVTTDGLEKYKRSMRWSGLRRHVSSYRSVYLSMVLFFGIGCGVYSYREPIVARLVAMCVPVPSSIIDVSIGKDAETIIKMTGSVDIAKEVSKAPGSLTSNSIHGTPQLEMSQDEDAENAVRDDPYQDDESADDASEQADILDEKVFVEAPDTDPVLSDSDSE